MPQLKSSQSTTIEANYYPGMIGNIGNPLLEIPFKRANDENALSGVQTFTRASTGTYIDALDGLVKTAIIDTPRFERMADGGTGILLEDTSTNLLPHSDIQGVGVTQTQLIKTVSNTTLAPDGVTLIEGWTTNISNANDPSIQYAYNNGTPNNGVTFTFSFWAKGSGISIGKSGRIFLYTQTAQSIPFTLTAVWTRFEFTATIPVADVGNFVKARIDPIDFNIDPIVGNDVVYLWGAQLETLPFATSYIPTTTVAVTRATDILSIPTADNIGNNSMDKSIVFDIDFTLVPSSSVHYIYDLGINYVRGYLTGNNLFIQYGSNVQASKINFATVGKTTRVAAILRNKRQLLYLDSVFISDRSENIPTAVPTKIILHRNANGFYGHLRNFRIYDRALTPQEAQLV